MNEIYASNDEMKYNRVLYLRPFIWSNSDKEDSQHEAHYFSWNETIIQIVCNSTRWQDLPGRSEPWLTFVRDQKVLVLYQGITADGRHMLHGYIIRREAWRTPRVLLVYSTWMTSRGTSFGWTTNLLAYSPGTQSCRRSREISLKDSPWSFSSTVLFQTYSVLPIELKAPLYIVSFGLPRAAVFLLGMRGTCSAAFYPVLPPIFVREDSVVRLRLCTSSCTKDCSFACVVGSSV